MWSQFFIWFLHSYRALFSHLRARFGLHNKKDMTDPQKQSETEKK